MLQIYCGDGKGKTTAAIGLAVRAAGYGKRVLIVRFLKNDASGEIRALKKLPEVTFLHPEKAFGFYRTLTEEGQRECKQVYRRLWEKTVECVQDSGYELVILDEFMAAYRYGMIPEEEAVYFLEENKKLREMVLTGRDPAEEIAGLADYISEIHKIRHPFDRGVLAREGIEY